MISLYLSKDRTHALMTGDSLSIIREHFSCPNPSYRGSSRGFNTFAAARIYNITPKGKFDIGLLEEIYKYCIAENIPYTADSELVNAYTPLLKAEVAKLPLPNNMSLRDYQHDSVAAALKKGRGVIVLPTAAGKTLTIATLACSILAEDASKCLIIVPSIQLVEQTYDDFIKYGVQASAITKWSGSNSPDLASNIIIASAQILQSEKQDTSILDKVDLLIVDECHKLRKGNQISDIVKSIKAPYKFGFTGTMPAEQIDQWNIIGKLGPIIYLKRSIDLRNVQQIAGVEIQIIDISYVNAPQLAKPNPTNPTKAYSEENDFLNANIGRNNIISNICKNTDKNTLVMVERIPHGQELTDIITQACPHKKVYFIRGSVDVEIRENIRQLMERENNICCIAISKIFSTGISINNLHYIVFAAAGKAKIKILQSIGRGLRLHPLKNKVNIFDIADDLRYGRKHVQDRIKLYEEEKIQYKRHRILCQ